MKLMAFIFGFKHAIILVIIAIVLFLVITKYISYCYYEKQYQGRDSDFEYLTKKEYTKILKKYK